MSAASGQSSAMRVLARLIDPNTERGLLLILIGVLTILRVALLWITDFDLGPDEAQYWTWSREFAWGYFSKPPMIGWLIGLMTFLFGDGEAAVRMASPLLYFGAAWAIYETSALLFSPRTGFWAGLTFATIPAITLSSGLITTDVPLLFFWSLALFALVKLEDTPRWRWAIVLGLSIGLGFLSKYAMIYFLLGLALVLAFSPRYRSGLPGGKLAVAILIAAAVFAPNVYWNLTNGLSTVSHTAANANWGDDLFRFDKLWDFFSSQFGVFGPILFGVLIWLVYRGRRLLSVENPYRDRDLFLACFVLPPLIIILVQSFLSRAHANWAATAYIAGSILVTDWLLRHDLKALLRSSLALHLALGAVLYTLFLFPPLIDGLGWSNAVKRVRGWSELTDIIAQTAQDERADVLVAFDRKIAAELMYYTRRHDIPVRAVAASDVPTHHFEQKYPLKDELQGRGLAVTERRPAPDLWQHFERSAFLKSVTVELGSGRSRTVYLYQVSGFRG